jgi:hypothetical protein
MYNWEDILIVGDSFCAERDDDHDWPFIVSNTLSGSSKNTRGEGFSGASWWSVRKCLLTNLEINTPKILIICHTEPFRIPNDDNYGLNFRSVEVETFPTDLQVAARKYYENLMSKDFHEWACLQWFKELDNIIEKHKIEKVIHFFCFGGAYSCYLFNKGVTIKNILYDISYNTPDQDIVKTFNHFTPDGNKTLAKNILNILNDYPGNGIETCIQSF